MNTQFENILGTILKMDSIEKLDNSKSVLILLLDSSATILESAKDLSEFINQPELKANAWKNIGIWIEAIFGWLERRPESYLNPDLDESKGRARPYRGLPFNDISAESCLDFAIAEGEKQRIIY